MKTAAILISSLLLSGAALAHGGEHPGHEEGEFDVEAYTLTLQGTQAFGEACYVGVVSQGNDENGVYFAEVETSFEHEGEGPGRLRVSFDANRPNLLSASTESGSRINVQLSEGGTGLADALRYAVAWVHEDHTDTGLCSDLKVVHDAAAEAETQEPVAL